MIGFAPATCAFAGGMKCCADENWAHLAGAIISTLKSLSNMFLYGIAFVIGVTQLRELWLGMG